MTDIAPSESTTHSSASAAIIPAHLAITAMRDSGYKNTAYALAELIDNSVQANASIVEVLCLERFELVASRQRRRLHKIAVLDDGVGMDLTTLRMALQFGNGTRLDDRSGIGRFGMGLPSASISQARRVDVWTWQNGPDNALHTFIDLDKIEDSSMHDVPSPDHLPLPDDWRELSSGIGHRGTAVVWSKLDHQRLTWKSARLTLVNTERIVGRVHRRFVADTRVKIRLVASTDETETPMLDYLAAVNDPLYLTPSASMPKPFDSKPMFSPVFSYPHVINYGGRDHTILLTFSVATRDTVTVAVDTGVRERGHTKYGKHAMHNIGVSVIRANREITLDKSWCIGYDPRERWWGAEVEFPPALDDLFGLTNNKQAVNHFTALASLEWEDVSEDGEEFRDVVRRLKEDEDPRGWLLELSDEIKRNLGQLRDRIKAQGVQRRAGKKRHPEPDDATKGLNKKWKDRSEEKPIPGEKTDRTQSDLREIEEDLKENKGYSEDQAKDLVTMIEDAKLNVLFLEADFPNSYELFNVELKGSVTEITFNRKHPAFEDIFGTVATADRDLEELSAEEAIEMIRRAVNSTKLTFAAWARYEREAGIRKAEQLRKVRFDWGQIAAQFLQAEDDWEH